MLTSFRFFLILFVSLFTFSVSPVVAFEDFVIIIDDLDDGVSYKGKWKESKAANLYGETALGARNKKNKIHTSVFQTAISEAGTYRVEIWNPMQRRASAAAPHKVSHLFGETMILVNQRMMQGQWVALGDFEFESVASVSISTEPDYIPNTSIPKNERKIWVSADAVRFTLLERSCEPLCNVSIWLNEASSSNTQILDENGDSSDWFELYNRESHSINLDGWSITDDSEKPDKWVFPDVTLDSGTYLQVWASDKDRKNLGQYRTLVNQGHVFRYLWPFDTISNDWVLPDFDDGGWSSGPSGFGYGDNDDATVVSEDARAIYIRTTFEVTDVSGIESLFLDVDYDDAFVAYLNGVEVARANIAGDYPSFDAEPFEWHEAQMYQGGRLEQFEIANPQVLLETGTNTLSLQVHNISDTSSDLSVIPFLTAKYLGASEAGVVPPGLLGYQDDALHTNFKLSSKGETLYLYTPDGVLHDRLDVVGLVTDVTVGRSLENANNIVYYAEPTPAAENTSTEYLGVVTSDIVFSDEGGVSSGQSVSLSGAIESERIRYTLDATKPENGSVVYDSPIILNGNTVVRARIFKPGYIPSRVATKTFLPGVSHDLPVVTLVSDPDNFFNEQTGIYVFGDEYESTVPYFGANFWQDWEREIHFAFYEPGGELGVAIDAGVKISGGWSRANDQRSFSIFARGRYGFKELEYPLFPDVDYDEFQSVVLRNSGSDWMSSMIRDAVMTSLMDGSGIDYQAYRPVATYLNGEYWGMYNLRERVNEHFIDAKNDVDKDELDRLESNAQVIQGTNAGYKGLVNFIKENDLSDPESYAVVGQQIDIGNFVRYQVAQIYFDNRDWPGNNIKYWKSPETKWRWILFDTDFGFNLYGDDHHTRDTLSFALFEHGSGWPNPAWSTLFLRKLVANTEFKYQLINQFADDLNSRFSADNVIGRIDEHAAAIETEMPRHFTRWNRWLGDWQFHLTRMKNFANNRVDYLRNHVEARFGLSGSSQLSIENLGGGTVMLNTLTLVDAAWQGVYFNDVPLKLVAIPDAGSRFACWLMSGAVINERYISPVLSEDSSIQVIFTDQADPETPAACQVP